MKKLLNTLYVTSQGSYLHRDGETVEIRQDKETRLKVPIHTLGGIVCFGQVMCSPPLMGLCGEQGIPITFLSEYGRFWGRVQGPVQGNVLLRRAQYRATDDPEHTAAIARAIVMAKLANNRAVLLRATRDRPECSEAEVLRTAGMRLGQVVRRLERIDTVDSIRGCEGEGSRIYFESFNLLITNPAEEFTFEKRTRRPPLDRVNALLSFLYTLLTHDCVGALEGVGLDPAVGYLHRERPGRPSLALDLMEELRPVLGDRVALSLINRKQLKATQFKVTESGAVHMDDDARKTLLVTYQERKQEEIMHPYLNEKISLGLLPHAQALLLARHLRGDIDGYPPFLWR